MSKISPCLWFNGQAEAAAEFYVSLIEPSEILTISRYDQGAPFPAGTALVVEFSLAGQTYQALNGGPQYQHSEAISLSVSCEDQAEVDRLWNAITADGGEESQCGWCKDRFGVSWQVVPKGLSELIGDPDPGRRNRALQAMFGMRRLDLAAMRAAADQAAD